MTNEVIKEIRLQQQKMQGRTQVSLLHLTKKNWCINLMTVHHGIKYLIVMP